MSPASLPLIMPKTLGQYRRLHTLCLVQLLLYIEACGYHAALDTVKTNESGEGHLATGCHPLGLAADILLYDAVGIYLTETSDHAKFGIFWKSLHPLCRWGGDFRIPDGNHYSLISPDKKHA